MVNIILLIQDSGAQLASSTRLSPGVIKEYVIITLKSLEKNYGGYIYFILVYPMV